MLRPTFAMKTIEYREFQGGPWLPGFLLNNGEGELIGLDGQPVDDLWEYQDGNVTADIRFASTEGLLIVVIVPHQEQP